jgi:hypothetical protein
MLNGKERGSAQTGQKRNFASAIELNLTSGSKVLPRAGESGFII